MIQETELNSKQNVDETMDISFWVDIEKQKKFINTNISRGILNEEEEFEKEIINIMECNNVPLYLKSLISEEIKNILSISKIRNADENQEDNIKNVEYKSKLIEKFKNNTIKYNKSSFQPIFPKAYNSLINSNIPNLNDILLSLERDYAKQIEEVWKTKEKTEMDMKTTYNQQVEVRNGGNLTKLMTHHYEDMELIKATYDSQIEELKNIQKKEYKFVIENLYNKIKSREDINTIEEIQEIIKSVVNEFKDYSNKNNIKMTPVLENLVKSLKSKLKIEAKDDTIISPKITSNIENPISPIDNNNKLISPSKEKEIKDDEKEKESNDNKEKENPNVKELLDMGFTNDQAKAALELSKNNLEQAIFYLLEKPFVVEEHIKKTKEKMNEMKTLSKSPFNSMLNLNWNDTEKTNSIGTSEPFLPISRSLTNLNLKSTSIMGMKKLGSLIGSIKDISAQASSSILNRQSEEPENFEYDSTLDEELSESFTMYYGTQVRMMYNIRIMVQNFENLFKIPKNNEQQLAYFAQTASSLYSDNINGIIVLLTPSDWPKYAMGESANKTPIQQCKRTTEFHFDDIEKQLITIEKTLPKKDGKPVLNEGDFFVTCHSNIPLIHVVFHLVVNDKYKSSKELISRTKCINGYKNILSYAHKYDINNLTIPLLILPNEQINDLMEKSKKNKNTLYKDSILNQYIEVLLKNTKVYMIESSRMIKHSLDSSGTEKNSRTLQFILPKSVDTDLFNNVVDSVSKIFRTS